MDRVDIFRGFTHHLIADLFFVQADIAGNSAGKDKRILQYRSNMSAQVFLAYIAYINTVDVDSTFLDIVEA